MTRIVESRHSACEGGHKDLLIPGLRVMPRELNTGRYSRESDMKTVVESGHV